jgi:hypothetical protein
MPKTEPFISLHKWQLAIVVNSKTIAKSGSMKKELFRQSLVTIHFVLHSIVE